MNNKEKIVQLIFSQGGFWGTTALLALTDRGNIYYQTPHKPWKKELELPEELQPE